MSFQTSKTSLLQNPGNDDDDALVLWLPMDYGDGQDFSGQCNNATIGANVSQYRGYVPFMTRNQLPPRALTFGTTGGLTCGPVPGNAFQVFTMMSWVQFASLTANNNDIFSSSAASGPLFRTTTASLLQLEQKGTASIATSTGTLVTNRWFHVAVSYGTGGAWVFYINGARDSSGTNNVTFVSGNVLVGDVMATNGQLTGMRYYNRVLTPGEVRDIYSRELQGVMDDEMPLTLGGDMSNVGMTQIFVLRQPGFRWG